MEAFFLAAAMHPDCQKAGHAYLDSVIVYDSFTYMRAFVKELSRWHIVTPIGLPHATVDDDEYNGYLIPAGTVVNFNVWCVDLSGLRSLGFILHS